MLRPFPNESAKYRAARDELLAQEIELRRMQEKVARARRALPLGGEAPEYVFEDATGEVTLAELFAGKDTLAVYSYMFSPDWKEPCQMCTPLIAGLAAVEPHLAQRLTLVVVAESPIAKLMAEGKKRGWTSLRLASAAGNHFNRDYWGKGEEGEDTTMLNVFHKVDGKVRHFWGTEMTQAPSDEGQHHRGLDPLNPIFNLLDFTPEGRGDFVTKHRY